MEIEVVSKKKNELLERVEMEFKITHPNEGSPKRDAIRNAIAKMENATKELVVVDRLNSEYGLASTRGFAKIYKSKERALELERKHILIRNALIAEKKKEAKKKEPKPEPKEEKVEEKPPEKVEKKEKPEKEEKKPKETEEKKPKEEKPKEEAKKPKEEEAKKEKPTEKSKK